MVGPDLPRHLYEVEVKYSWKGNEVARQLERVTYTASVSKRLLDKWKSECYNDLLTFVVFNNDCTMAWHVDGNTLLECEVKEASNYKIRKGEKFFHIPVEDAYMVDMTYESDKSDS